MSTLARQVEFLARRSHGIGRVALVLATALWTFITVEVFTDQLTVPHGPIAVLAFPVGALAVSALFGGRLERELGMAAAWSALVAGAFWIAPFAGHHVVLAFSAPAALVAAIFAGRYPAAAVLAVLALTASLGSLQAFTGIKVGPPLDLLLVGLWVATLVRLLTVKRAHSYLLWPAIAACMLYIALSTAEIFTAATPGLGFLSFRTSTWYMLAFPLLAYAGWSRDTYRRIAKGLVILTVLVAGYAVLRWQIGPAGAERDLAIESSAGINLINGQLRTVGSFITGHQLALWTSIMAPFSLAFALASRGRWRLAAAIGTALCVFAMLASEARGPLVGMVLGMAIVLVLFAASRAFRLNVGAALAGITALVVAAAVAFTLTAGSSGAPERYTAIFHPGQDPAYIARTAKWRTALADINRHPFGQGLGTAGQAQQEGGQYLTVASQGIDSAYLEIAYQQGIVVMVFFIGAFVLLVARLATAATATRDPERAVLAIGAAGVLGSMLITFYSGLYNEAPPVVAGWIIIGLGLSGLVTVPADVDAAEDRLRVEAIPSTRAVGGPIPARAITAGRP